MDYVIDEGKYTTVLNLETGEKLPLYSLEEVLGVANRGERIYTEISRQNFDLDARARFNKIAEDKGIQMFFIPTKAIKIWRWDNGLKKPEGKKADLVDARNLRKIVREGRIHFVKPNPPSNERLSLLNDVRNAAASRTIEARTTGWGKRRQKKEMEELLGALPPCTDPFLADNPNVKNVSKLRYKSSRIIPLVIAAQEVKKAGRGFKFFESVIGNHGNGYPNIFRSNLNYHWLKTFVKNSEKETHYEKRKEFFKTLRPKLKWIFAQSSTSNPAI